jgi:hypothetical protein
MLGALIRIPAHDYVSRFVKILHVYLGIKEAAIDY